MKRFLTLCFFSLIFFVVFAGSGTETDPFTVAQAIAKYDNSSKTYWVKGYIVGEMRDFSNNKYFYELAPPFSGTGAYLLADNPDEINLSKCFPVQLGTAYIDNYNLEENPQYWRKEVLVCGLLRDYFAMPGLKTLTSLTVSGSMPLSDETKAWNFYEDMDGSYQAASASSIFAGGTYAGETGSWKLYGATWGDSSNDSKWGKAAARLRLSEASTGNPGYMQMEFDKPDGAGIIRFWSGYYDTDNGGSLAVYVSTNQGQSWGNAIAQTAIAKGWKEYQFVLNVPGNVRVRIMKAENGSAGINVDNIRISDYKVPNAVDKINVTQLPYRNTDGGILLKYLPENEEFRLFNITGKLILQRQNVNSGLFIGLTRGVYFLKNKEKPYKIICQ
ncbi:MAG: DUF6359 domain-containing protein [Paludibacter sp.]|nr:DUF6359 domain-containing protein [Paludibacter sp.]